ncbi:nitrate assimilation regulatory protein nirA [Xylariomycetidae sp. FL2044]|nr:nitrate assimilation regulatory protein nirA [Xylariomycetidae sp. FL2044]
MRPVLPRSEPPGPPQSPTSPLIPKRKPIIAACETCRKRKSKCDGRRPICSSCASTGRECLYSTKPSESRAAAHKRKYDQVDRELNDLRESHANLLRLIHAVRTRSEADAAAIFQRLREGGDTDSILRHISTGDLLMELQVAPETRSRFEFPYKREMPAHLQIPNNPYLRSTVYEASFVPQLREHQDLSPELATGYGPQYIRPYIAARLLDHRLDDVKPSAWTSVSDDDHLMRMLLRSYFLYEYHFLTMFHKDLFLDDMLSGSKRFCSPLLVNAVLAQACNCYAGFPDRGEYWNPRTLGYKFFTEARRLWEMERTESITTIQAAMITNILYNMYSMDKLGMTYALQAVSMAYSLGLFSSTAHIKNPRRRHAYEFTSWCIYCWGSLQCYQYLIPPLVHRPPDHTLPDPDQNPTWYGELWVRYPSSQVHVCMHHSHVFKSKVELVQVVNRVATYLFSEGRDNVIGHPAHDIIVGFVNDMHRWYSSLPACLTPDKIVFPSQLKLHLMYWNVLIDLYKLLSNSDMARIEPYSGSLSGLSGELVHASVCFETIVRLYYLRHGFEGADAPMAHNLQIMAFMELEQLRALSQPGPAPPLPASASSVYAPFGSAVTAEHRDEVRASLILAVKGLNDQGRNYFMPLLIFHIIERQMSPEDVEDLYRSMGIPHRNGKVAARRARYAKAQYPINIVKITDHPDSLRLENLAKEYHTLAIEEISSGESDLGT